MSLDPLLQIIEQPGVRDGWHDANDAALSALFGATGADTVTKHPGASH